MQLDMGTEPPTSNATPRDLTNSDLPSNVVDLLRKGRTNKIQAIRELRILRPGLELADAANLIDEACRALLVSSPQKDPQESDANANATPQRDAGDILMFEFSQGQFGACRVLGCAETIDGSRFNKYAQMELKKNLGSVFLFVTTWFGNSRPILSDPKLLQPLYMVRSGFIEDYYALLTRWLLREETVSFELIASVPLTDLERQMALGILVPSINLRGIKSCVQKQFEALQSAELACSSIRRFIQTADEDALKKNARFKFEETESLGGELDALIGELCYLGERFEFVNAPDKLRARSIGQQLFDRGGRNMMLAVWWRVERAQKRLSMQTLNSCWHGIGGWTS